jgi:cellulase (glycosyl hydrolase family 5)
MRQLVLGFATAVLVLAFPVAVEAEPGPAGDGAQTAAGAQVGTEATGDPVALRAQSDLRRFTRWLAAGSRSGMGMIGEVGWPGDPTTGGDPRWNRLAADWYGEAESAGLWVAAWATGEFWAPSYKLLAYGASAGPVDRANLQAGVIEQQQAPHLRGINVAGAEFATPVDERVHSFSNANHGTYGRDYIYPSQATLAYLAGRGVTFVRLPVRWERLQPALGRPLDGDETRRLLECIDRARAAGLEVVLDVHNYGAYYVHDPRRGTGVRRAIGSRRVPSARFANLWSRLARVVGADPTVIGFGLMNEPVGMRGARAWEAASRAAVRAIRATGSNKRVFVQSYLWGGAAQFALQHPRGPWIDDGNTWYEAHQYFDLDRSARYALSYDQEAATARPGA